MILLWKTGMFHEQVRLRARAKFQALSGGLPSRTPFKGTCSSPETIPQSNSRSDVSRLCFRTHPNKLWGWFACKSPSMRRSKKNKARRTWRKQQRDQPLPQSQPPLTTLTRLTPLIPPRQRRQQQQEQEQEQQEQ